MSSASRSPATPGGPHGSPPASRQAAPAAPQPTASQRTGSAETTRAGRRIIHLEVVSAIRLSAHLPLPLPFRALDQLVELLKRSLLLFLNLGRLLPNRKECDSMAFTPGRTSTSPPSVSIDVSALMKKIEQEKPGHCLMITTKLFYCRDEK